MATGGTNAGGRAESLRMVKTNQVGASAAIVALLAMEEGDSLDKALEILHEATKMVVGLDEDVRTLYGLEESADMNAVFRAIKETVVPEAVKVSDSVKGIYGLEEADINMVFQTIAEKAIPDAIQEAIGDVLDGEY